MKQGLFLVLLAHCLNGLHICPTFPYCTLQPSGLWSSLPVFRVNLDKPDHRIKTFIIAICQSTFTLYPTITFIDMDKSRLTLC